MDVYAGFLAVRWRLSLRGTAHVYAIEVSTGRKGVIRWKMDPGRCRLLRHSP
jgi:hypothetical protein